MQIRTLLMVRPLHFGYNAQTAESNSFQHTPSIADQKVAELAQREFDAFAETLKNHGIPVHIVEDLPGTPLPDSVFPNNWFSTHPGGILNIYPMLTPSRQDEVREDILEFLQNKYGYNTRRDYRTENGICEGTGSLVFDHENKIAYAVISLRTERTLTEKIIRDLRYTPVFLEAFNNKIPIYHTNVMLCVAPEFMLVCLDSLNLKSLEHFIKNAPDNKPVLSINASQMNAFAGNMLSVDCKAGKFLIMSETARKCLLPEQVEYIEEYRKIVSVNIPTIETVGGGSARCMLAEIF